jgi:ferredoxin
MSSIFSDVGNSIGALVTGLGVTFRNMLRKTVTENYPEEPVHFQARYRGIHVLQRDEDGLEKCVGCFLCAAACPARCIYIEAADNTADKRISAGDRYALYFLRLLRRSVSHRRDHARPRLRARHLRHQLDDLSQRAAAQAARPVRRPHEIAARRRRQTKSPRSPSVTRAQQVTS